MIVACEQCESRFRLDDSLLKDEGSKVRCSRCGHVFLVRPPREEPQEPETLPAEEAGEETIVLDSPSEPEASGVASPGETLSSGGEEPVDLEEGRDEGDLAFEGGVEEEGEEDLESSEKIDAVSPESLPGLEETTAGLDDVFERASGIEDRVTREDTEEKGREEDLSPQPEQTGPVAETRRGSRLLRAMIGLVLLVVAAYAVIHVVSPDLLPEALRFSRSVQERAPADPGVKRLSFADVKGAFVRTEAGKQRFVIRGEIINNYPDGRRFIQVKASILDEKGRSVRSRTAYAGNAFSQGELVGEPMASLETGMKRREGKDKRNAAIASGGRIPFMVVFQGLPKDISEFTVEAVGSSPGERT